MPAAVFFDTETTGLPQWHGGVGHPKQPHIVQLAAIMQDLETREVLHTLCCLMKVPDDVQIDPQAEAVHKKSKALLNTFGYRAETVLKMFQVMLERAEVVVAHNLGFDSLVYEAAVLRGQGFLSMDPFRKCRASCTMLNSVMLCKLPNPKKPGTFKWPKLNEAWPMLVGNKIGKSWNELEAHDALFDVRRCQELYWAIQDLQKGVSPT